MLKMIEQGIKMLLWMTILTGIIYPGIVLLMSYLFFPIKSQGSFIEIDGKVIGSKLIAQKFVSDRYFWSRPSVGDYNPLKAGGSNLGPTSKELKKLVNDRKNSLMKTVSLDNFVVPADLLFASGSGLDPHISPEAAHFQIERISKARSLSPATLTQLIVDLTEEPTLRMIGPARINVLLLNQRLDQISEAEAINE